MSQRPDATVGAGYRTWQSLGRQVRRGAKGIGIFGYSTKTTAQEVTDDAGKTDEKTTTRTFFPVRTVFDISDTDGDDIGLPTEVDSARNPHPDASDKAYQRVSTWLTDQGWDVQRVDITGAIRGYTNHTEKLVRVADHLDDINAARVLLHEAARCGYGLSIGPRNEVRCGADISLCWRARWIEQHSPPGWPTPNRTCQRSAAPVSKCAASPPDSDLNGE